MLSTSGHPANSLIRFSILCMLYSYSLFSLRNSCGRVFSHKEQPNRRCCFFSLPVGRNGGGVVSLLGTVRAKPRVIPSGYFKIHCILRSFFHACLKGIHI